MMRNGKTVIGFCGKLLVLAIIVGCLAGSAMAGKVLLNSGLEVKVTFDPNIRVSSGHSVAGVPVLISLAEPIVVGGEVIVEKGAQGTAVIGEVEKAKRAGKPGRITVEFVDLAAKGPYEIVGEDRIKLSGTEEAKGKSRKTLSYLFIFGLFIKGTQGEIPTNQVYTARIAEDVFLESK